jgi:hypothetical protein
VDQFRAERAAQDLGGAIGDHLVGIGIGRGARAGLKDVEHELIVEQAVGDLLRCLRNGVGLALVDQSEIAVGHGRGVFDGTQRPDEAAVEALAADGKVVHCPLGGSAVVRALGHLERTHRVALDSLRRHTVAAAIPCQRRHSSQ